MRFAESKRASSNEYTSVLPSMVDYQFSGVPLVSSHSRLGSNALLRYSVRCDYISKIVVSNKWITYGMFYIFFFIYIFGNPPLDLSI